MRIVLATTAPALGGVSRNLFDLARGLKQRGHRVTVSSRQDAPPLIEAAADAGLPWLPLHRSVREPADIWHLHLHNTLDTRALPLLVARRTASRGAVVMTEHLPRVLRTDPQFPSELPADLVHGRRRPGAEQMKALMKRAELRVSDAVIAVSHSSERFIARRWGADARKLTTIYNGVAVPSEPSPPRGGQEMLVLGIAALHWLKGFDVLIEAAAQASEPWNVQIVGDGVERKKLEAKAAALQRSRQIEFLGWRHDASRASLEADVVCAPSRAESFSYVVLEAMACARPLVAAAVDGAAEAINDGETGLLVPTDDPGALANALDALARDPGLRARMGTAAHARVASQFALERMVDATVDLYERTRRQWPSTSV